MIEQEQKILLEYESVQRQRKSNELLTPFVDENVQAQANAKTFQMELPDVIDNQVEFKKQKTPYCLKSPHQGTKIMKLHQILPKKFCQQRQINLFECKNRETSKSKKKLNLSLTSQNKSQEKNHKSGLKLCIARSDSITKIHSFKLLEVQGKKQQIRSPSQLSQKKLKEAEKMNLHPAQKKLQKKKIKLHKLRA